MANLKEHIQSVNNKNEKVLSIFLTAGFPNKNKFVDLACKVFDAGADIIELGIPFSDPLADGPVIQHSSHLAIQNGVSIKDVLTYTEQIKNKNDKPIVLMGYANPILNYGKNNFFRDAKQAGVHGLIISDVPLEEYDSFFEEQNDLDVVLLTTPTSTEDRIMEIDERSKGFIYCVSVTGTTGIRKEFSSETLNSLKSTHSIVKNKMLVGFGISSPENIKQISPFCDGVIVGSAVIKRLMNGDYKIDVEETVKLVNQLKEVCKTV
ncbi:MAG: tryptophan synthase subunit alpha [Ignavibacteriales bacterium]|nr:MAG: tryptophan synthase subunit alpha [Ignavibacteriales bacterium]